MKLSRTGKKEAPSGYGIPGPVTEEGTVSFKEEVNLVFSRAVGMIPSVPGKTITACKPVDKHRIQYFHTASILKNTKNINFRYIKSDTCIP
jgi:hypothetical protein